MRIESATSAWLLETPTRLPYCRIVRCLEKKQGCFWGTPFQSCTRLFLHHPNLHLLPTGSILVTTPHLSSGIMTLLETSTTSNQQKNTLDQQNRKPFHSLHPTKTANNCFKQQPTTNITSLRNLELKTHLY